MIACDEQVEQTQRHILTTESSLCGLYIEKEQAQKESIRLHAQQEDMSGRQKENEQLLRSARSEQAEIEQHIHQIQMELSQLSVKEEDLCQRVREELQISQEEAADRCGLHRTYYSGVERGVRNVSLVNIERIAKGLKVPLPELFDRL
jgi:DNA-binding XRE family transcriptional regulator